MMLPESSMYQPQSSSSSDDEGQMRMLIFCDRSAYQDIGVVWDRHFVLLLASFVVIVVIVVVVVVVVVVIATMVLIISSSSLARSSSEPQLYLPTPQPPMTLFEMAPLPDDLTYRILIEAIAVANCQRRRRRRRRKRRRKRKRSGIIAQRSEHGGFGVRHCYPRRCESV